MRTLHLADIGTSFELTVTDQDGAVVDLSSATTKSIVFAKPSGETVTQTASLVNTGTDGKMEYVTVSGDIDEVGVWEVQGVVTIGAATWHTDTEPVTVLENL